MLSLRCREYIEKTILALHSPRNDALAAASDALLKGEGFGAIAAAAKVKSKAPDIKRLAALEESPAEEAAKRSTLRSDDLEVECIDM